ncbi:MAG: hypothetical protein ACI959_001623 [Limisphaerales bacterium]|jgi:hypothetical protein
MGLVAKICMIGFSAALLILSITSVMLLWGGLYIGVLTSPYVIGNLLQILYLFFLVIFCHQFSKVVGK